MKVFVIVDSDGQRVWGVYTSEERANEERIKANKSLGGYGSFDDVWYNKIAAEIEMNDKLQ